MPSPTGKVTGLLLAGAGALALLLTTAIPADAARSKKKSYQVRAVPATVVAVGRSRPEVVVGQVRRGRWGQEVRLPGGTWIDCKGDCRETLREETVDFWERQEQRGGRDRTRR